MPRVRYDSAIGACGPGHDSTTTSADRSGRTMRCVLARFRRTRSPTTPLPMTATASPASPDIEPACRGPHSSSIGCQPPCCGGVPPLPRRRSAPAIPTANPTAASARRINFTTSETTARTDEASLRGARPCHRHSPAPTRQASVAPERPPEGQARRGTAPRSRTSVSESGEVGLTRIELVTSSLSGMRSNRLSYSPLRL